MAAMRTPPPARFGSQWSNWVIIAAVLLLLIALALYMST
jgi:hypothetical protein